MNLGRLQNICKEYPSQFWLLIGASFIDMVGNALIFPFFAMFLTDKYDVSLTRVGVIFAIFSIAGIAGSTIGGALTDRFGRKRIALSGLVLSALGNMAIVLNDNFTVLYLIAGTLGVVGSIGGPAWQAMMADLLPEEKRAEGFGLIRIAFNVAVMFGPMIGGLLAGVSYLLLFSVDVATSMITAAILVVFLRETRPEKKASDPAEESLLQTFQGYGQVLRDRVFLSFALLGAMVWLVYFQMNTTLAVFLRDQHGIEPAGFGVLLSLNAVIVVAFQFWTTRKVRMYPAMFTLTVGTLFYAIGFSMFGYTGGYALFVAAMVIITIGEMLVVPTGQAIAVRLAPEHMRGRYMAVFGFGYAIASGSGTWLAGQINAHLGFEWVWYLAGVVATAAALGYLAMHYLIELPKTDPEFEGETAAEAAR